MKPYECSVVTRGDVRGISFNVTKEQAGVESYDQYVLCKYINIINLHFPANIDWPDRTIIFQSPI